MYWNIIIISLCLLLLLFLLWKEIKRPNRSWLTPRIIATVMAVVSLACIALPVSIKRQAIHSSIAIILTEGYNKDSVQKMIRAHSDPKVLTTNKAINAFGARYIPGIEMLSADSFNINAFHIFGYGLEQHELELLKNFEIMFHPGVIKNSITSVGWTQHLTSGENLVVQGTYTNSGTSPAKIILTGFDMNLDSASLPPGQTSFHLSATPKHLDKAVYSITVLSGKDTLQTDPLPVQVKAPGPLSILLLAASPDFENKFLKNWLTQNEYVFAVRTSISKNKYDKQYVNTTHVPLDRITASLLEKFDIVIADLAELKALPASDLGTIRSYVENRGMGLIVKAGMAERSSAFYLQSFPLTETRDSARHTVKLSVGADFIASALKIEQPLYIQNVAGTQPLVKDQQLRIVASSRMYGSGRVIVTTIPNTYSWWLAGNNNDYTSYWSLLLKKAAKRIALNNTWKVNEGIPRKDHEVHVKLQTGNTNVPRLQSGSDIIYPEQHYFLPYEWSARYWPAKTGWQSLLHGDSATSWLYIYNTSHWKGIRATEKINSIKKYASGMYSPMHNSIKAGVNVPVPKIYFFIVFLICSGFLWFEKKYRSG